MTLGATKLSFSDLDLEPSGADRGVAALILDTAAQAAKKYPKSVHGKKLFLSALRRELATKSKRLAQPKRFARLVVELNQKGLIALHRADLVKTMDPVAVDDSQIDLMNRPSDYTPAASFNFIELSGPSCAKLKGFYDQSTSRRQASRLRKKTQGLGCPWASSKKSH
jgi:hypothetical protein